MITIASLIERNWHDGQAWDGPPWPAFFLIPLLVILLATIAVLFALRRRSPGAVEIVAERYARGEIDEIEYRRRIAELRGNRSPRRDDMAMPEEGK